MTVFLASIKARPKTDLLVIHFSFLICYGPEFISKALDIWAYKYGIILDFTRPGKPNDQTWYAKSLKNLLKTGERDKFF